MSKHARGFTAALQRWSIPVSRLALFVVYIWFGGLKLFNASPANPLVDSLLQRTLPFISFNQFIIGFGIFEVTIGLAFIIPRFTRVGLLLLVPHMITTILPLVLLPALTWTAPFTPSLEGQYIIKNLLIISAAITIGGSYRHRAHYRYNS